LTCVRGFFVLVLRRPSSSPLFPYTTLFRSVALDQFGAVPAGHAAVRRDRLYAEPCGADRSASGRDVQESHAAGRPAGATGETQRDRKSTRLNSSHVKISYAVFCLKKKTAQN